MMKATYMSGLTTLLLSTTFVTADIAAPTGFYLGVQQGYNMMRSKYNTVNDDTIDAQSARGSQRTHGLVGEILLGGRKAFCNSLWTVGLELAFGSETNSLKKRLIHPNVAGAQLVEARLKRTYFFTPALTVGRNLNPSWHAFLKLGMPISHYNVRYDNLHFASTEVFRKKVTKIGFAPAMGAEYALTQRFSVQASVGFEWHPKISHTLRPFDNNLPLSSYTGKIRTWNSNIKIALLFKL